MKVKVLLFSYSRYVHTQLRAVANAAGDLLGRRGLTNVAVNGGVFS